MNRLLIKTDAGGGGVRWQARMRTWLAQSDRPGQLWLGKSCVIVAWLGLLLAVISPPHGSGMEVCFLQGATGLPCLGCGLTRSLSCGVRGMFIQSWHYHPMGMAILVLFGFTALQSLLPGHWRDQFKDLLQTRAIAVNLLYVAFVALFVIYGVARALATFQFSGG
jgi:hypothetical protein